MNLEVAGSSPAGVATTNYPKPLLTNKLNFTSHSHGQGHYFTVDDEFRTVILMKNADCSLSKTKTFK